MYNQFLYVSYTRVTLSITKVSFLNPKISKIEYIKTNNYDF